MDTVSPERRSEIMGLVRSKNTVPEVIVRKALHARGFRFRLHGRDLPGRPDVVLARHRAVVFVHGCFWHRHTGCLACRTPKSRIDFWTRKFSDNVRRDVASRKSLAALGWRILVIWECEAVNPERLGRKLARFMGEMT